MACSSPERIADTSMASVETTLEAARDKSVNSSFLSTWGSHEWIALIELLKHHAAQIMVPDIRMLRAYSNYTTSPHGAGICVIYETTFLSDCCKREKSLNDECLVKIWRPQIRHQRCRVLEFVDGSNRNR